MRRLPAIAVLLVVLGMPTLASADPPVVEVYPTGIHPLDAESVQLALDTVDSPGIVIMKATDTVGNPLAFNFGGTAGTMGSGAIIKLLRPGITLTGEGWDEALGEPRTKIVGGGGPYRFTPLVGGVAMVFAVNAPGVTLRDLKLESSVALTGVWIDSVNQPAADWPVVVEGNDFNVANYHALVTYSAAFPVRVHGNVFHGPSTGQWTGFSHRTLGENPGEELVVPVDALGNAVRHRFEFTDNRVMMPTNHTAGTALWVFGWGNAYSQNPDPEVACRRARLNASLPYVYQYAPADNGPVLISGNHITVDSLNAYIEVVRLGGPAQGLNHALLASNRIDGQAFWGVSKYPYGHDVTVAGNDLSRLFTPVHFSIEGGGVTLADNVLGPQAPLPAPLSPMPDGVSQPSVVLVTSHYNPSLTPVPRPTENCVLARNDYRLTGVRSGAILIASQIDLRWTAAYGPAFAGEVKNNLIFETGRFPGGTGGARNQVVVLVGAINPDTGLPYTHDNRVVGQPAREIQVPAIGQVVAPLMRMKAQWADAPFER